MCVCVLCMSSFSTLIEIKFNSRKGFCFGQWLNRLPLSLSLSLSLWSNKIYGPYILWLWNMILFSTLCTPFFLLDLRERLDMLFYSGMNWRALNCILERLRKKESSQWFFIFLFSFSFLLLRFFSYWNRIFRLDHTQPKWFYSISWVNNILSKMTCSWFPFQYWLSLLKLKCEKGRIEIEIHYTHMNWTIRFTYLFILSWTT